MTPKPSRRSEQEGVMRFTREMGSALLMAFVFIVYVIQAFKIPTGSMEKSLLVNDFLLGLKFLYGSPALPFSYKKLPSLMDPKPGDVVIFEYPCNDFTMDNKDYIKRCVAGPGQTVSTNKTELYVDGKKIINPPNGQYTNSGILGNQEISEFAPLRIPKKGDTIVVDGLPVREFLFLRNLIAQENTGGRFAKFIHSLSNKGIPSTREDSLKADAFARVKFGISFFIDGEPASNKRINIADPYGQSIALTIDQWVRQYPFNRITLWVELPGFINYLTSQIQENYPGKTITFQKELFLDGKKIDRYIVKNDNYFMMGDNRDNSADSRYWGYANRNYIKAKAFILYFSMDQDVSWFLLPMKIRWNRIGKLIRSWDGIP